MSAHGDYLDPDAFSSSIRDEDDDVTITPAQRRRLEQAGQKLATATERRTAAVDECRQLAVDMHAAGMTEVELANLLGVDRARTIRRWLGKMTD